MWLIVESEGIEIGDAVETVGQSMEQELFSAQVWGMHFVRRKGCILYRLRRGLTTMPRLYSRRQLRLLTDKGKVRPGEIVHATPKWSGDGERLDVDF